jgi:hypothetical protein
MMANNKTNEVVHPHKTGPLSRGQNHAGGGGGATYHLSPHRIDPKSSAGGVAHGVWMMHVRLVGVPPPRLQAMVGAKAACSIGHPPHSLASPVGLRLRVGLARSVKKKNLD